MMNKNYHDNPEQGWWQGRNDGDEWLQQRWWQVIEAITFDEISKKDIQKARPGALYPASHDKVHPLLPLCVCGRSVNQ